MTEAKNMTYELFDDVVVVNKENVKLLAKYYKKISSGIKKYGTKIYDEDGSFEYILGDFHFDCWDGDSPTVGYIFNYGEEDEEHDWHIMKDETGGTYCDYNTLHDKDEIQDFYENFIDYIKPFERKDKLNKKLKAKPKTKKEIVKI